MFLLACSITGVIGFILGYMLANYMNKHDRKFWVEKIHRLENPRQR